MATALTALLALTFFASSVLALENVRIAIPSPRTLSILYLQMAQREGYLKEEGFQVELISVRGEIAVKAALAGEVDFFTQAGSALAAAVREMPLKILMVSEERPPWDLVAQPHVRSFSQLKGGTIGVLSLEGSVAVLTRKILSQNGIDPARDVTIMAMGSNEYRLMALRGKAIQATLLDPINSFLAQRDGFAKLASASDYVRHHIGGGVVVTEEGMRRAPDRIARILRASLKGLIFFLDRREPAVSHLQSILALEDRRAAAAVYDAVSKIYARNGALEEKLAQELIDDMKQITRVKRKIQAVDIFDFRFVRKASEELKASGWRP